jgi:starvation-inducible DNA-binding protein
LDTAEIVTQLNRLLSGYSVFQQKLRSYHWNIVGQDFFEMHDLFEAMCKKAKVETDEIAERIRFFGQRPFSTFNEYLNVSDIKEEIAEVTSFQMAKIVLKDIRNLLENMEEGISAAKEVNDNGTEFMLKKIIYNMEKDHWMLTAWIKQKV